MESNQSLFDLQVDQQSLAYLKESGRWARFIAIIGFIFCGLMVLAAFFVGTILGTMSASMGGSSLLSGIGGTAITVLYLLFALLWFIPCLFLYRFGSQARDAINNNQQDKLNLSLGNLKSYFKYIGILFIITLGLYALGIVGVVVGGLFASR